MESRLTSFAPQFLVDDLERSIAYYRKFGFQFGEPWEGFYAIGRMDGLELHLKEAPTNRAERDWRRDNEHLDASAGVDGIEAFYQRCVAAGVTICKPLAPTAWGTRDFYVEDPDGYIICFGGRPAAGKIEIRDEGPGDVAAIRRVNVEAFGQDEEAGIVDALRANGAVTLSLVATEDGAVVGHIMFSPVDVGTMRGVGLGPMSVLPTHQRQGIGSQLVHAGVARLRRARCPFIVLIGHPGFYPRFGFKPAAAYGLTCQWDVPVDAFMVALLDPGVERALRGVAQYRQEFSGLP
jgi:putative acetyltransferase